MKYITLISFIILGYSAKAQWTTDSTMNTTVRDSAGAMAPLMASLPNGSNYITWYENSATNLDLHMQLLDANGNNSWGSAGVVVSSFPQTTATYRYDLKTDHDGNAIVAFQDIRTGGNLNIVVYKVDVTGHQVWGNAGVSLRDSSSEEGLAPAIGITEQNDVVVAWNADSSSKKWIACERLSPSGSIVWNTIYRVVDSTNALKYSRPQLFASGTNDIQMLYVEENGSFPGVTSTLYTQKINSTGGNIFPSPIKVSGKTIPYFVFPIPVPDNHDGFYVAFDSSNPVNISLNDVYVQHVDASGNLWSADGSEAANSTVNNKTVGSSCLVNSMNEFWVLLQVEDGGQGQAGVSVQKFDGTGNILLGHDALIVLPMDPNIYEPITINDVTNGIIFSTLYGPFGNQHLYAVKVDYSGIPLWMNTTISLSSVNSNKQKAASSDFTNNNLVIMWQDDRNGSGVFAQNIDSTGGLGTPTGIFENNKSEQTKLFPNPSQNPELLFSETSHSDRTIIISDPQSREIFNGKIPANKFNYNLNNLPELSNGIYFVTIQNDNSKQTFRWIKN